MQLNDVLKRHLVTEKSMDLTGSDKYAFEVDFKASKSKIAQAATDLFNVEVKSVRTLIMPGKRKRILGTRRYTKTSRWKKAVIEVKAGQRIDLFEKDK